METINEMYWCTKCQKVCSGIDCECDNKLKVNDVAVTTLDGNDHVTIALATDSGAYIIDDEGVHQYQLEDQLKNPSDEILYKDHPEIPTQADIIAENQRIKESGKPYTEFFGSHGSRVVAAEDSGFEDIDFIRSFKII